VIKCCADLRLLCFTLCVEQVNLAACQSRCADKDSRISECEATIAANLAEIDAANVKIRHDETLRRKLHNTILELKVCFFASDLGGPFALICGLGLSASVSWLPRGVLTPCLGFTSAKICNASVSCVSALASF